MKFNTLKLLFLFLAVAGPSRAQSVLVGPAATLDVGNVVVGSTRTTLLTLTVMGNAAVTVNSATITGQGFSLSSPPAFPMTLQPDGTVTLTLSFSPTAQQVYSGSISVNSTACNGTSTVPITGTGSVASVYSSLWPSTTVPTTVDAGPDTPVELGLRFSSSQAGTVNGVKFYKAPTNTGTHTGTLWDASGNKLATVTFSNETASGWQSAYFATPVAITAGTTYVVSYHSTIGHYSDDKGFFLSKGVDAGPLHAPMSSSTSPNGVYKYGQVSYFPSSTWNQSNYWVDIVFKPATAAQQHSVDLKWTASTSTVSGYNVYRGSVSGGPYTKINSSLVSTTAYTDSTVVTGQTYYYVTTAQDASGVESDYSNEAMAMIPSP